MFIGFVLLFRLLITLQKKWRVRVLFFPVVSIKSFCISLDKVTCKMLIFLSSKTLLAANYWHHLYAVDWCSAVRGFSSCTTTDLWCLKVKVHVPFPKSTLIRLFSCSLLIATSPNLPPSISVYWSFHSINGPFGWRGRGVKIWNGQWLCCREEVHQRS